MEQQSQRRSFRRSSSRSPSLTRGTSFKEKSSSGITKSKKKGSGSKKERWLLTRKTWRYMSDAMGSFLPEPKDKAGNSSPSGPSTSRRASSTLCSPAPHTPTAPGPAFYSGILPVAHSYTTSVASVPASHGYGTTVTHVQAWPAQTPSSAPEPTLPSLEKRASLARSSICSGVAPLAESDIVATEENFEQMCQKERKFLLWTRTKPKGLSGPVLHVLKEKAERRRTSSSSSILDLTDTPETPRPTDSGGPLRSKRSVDLLEYYSQEEDLMDDYDDYDLEEEQLTVREFPPRKSSSGGSSEVSILSAGHSFWRPTNAALPISADSFTVATIRPGVQRCYRTTGIQTDPFPEEILIRLRLQSVREEQMQRQEADKLRQVKGEGMEFPPPEAFERKGSLEIGLAEPDKKSEESGYSSSISDTVMRYLRMVRKNSKPDTKEDKFKTVNYDRSLRNIKSKNVTVEEALEHEKNKSLAQQQKAQGSQTGVTGAIPAESRRSEQLPRKDISSNTTTSAPIKLAKIPSLTSGGAGKKKKAGGPLSPKSEGTASPPTFDSISSPEVGPSPPLSPPPMFIPPPSIGIQAGESLVRFLKHLNSTRTASDISSSYCGSSESPGDITSPRYSIATDASEAFTQSLGDDSSGQCQYHYYAPDRHRLSSEFSELASFKKQPSYGTSPYLTDNLKKSVSALQMRDKGASSPPSFSYPKGYFGLKPSLSASTPATPTVSPKPDSSSKMSRYMPTHSSGPVQFFSGLRRKGSAGREKVTGQVASSGSNPSAYSPSSSSGGLAESISSFLSKRSSYGKSGSGKVSESSCTSGSGSLGLSFSLRRVGSGKSGVGGGNAKQADAEHSNTSLSYNVSTVMQKSKSSSSVFHGEKRGSTSSASGMTTVGVSPASTSSGSRLMSKTRIFKSRSKSTGRSTPVCTWTPQGDGKWVGHLGQTVALADTNLATLSEKELEVLQKIAQSKARALNPGLEIKIPKESKTSTVKPKRRPYVLKKKALSTGFFDASSSREAPPIRPGTGTVFGVSLSEVMKNEKKHEDAKSGEKQGTGLDPESRCQSIPPQAKLDVVPAFVKRCVEFLELNGLHTKGLFRVSPSRMRVRQLREDLESGQDVIFREGSTVHDVAALLKDFLRELPEPLMTTGLYKAFLNTQLFRTNRKLHLQAIQHLVQLLPTENRETLLCLLQFFAKIAKFSADTICTSTGKLLPGNMMDSCNLATLIAPNLIPFLTSSGGQDLNMALQSKERQDSIDVVDFLISNHDQIFKVSVEVLDEVYQTMAEVCPETVEAVFKEKSGEETLLDDFDYSSVFGGSEVGDQSDVEESIAPRSLSKREEVLHKEAGKGGQPIHRRTMSIDKGNSRQDRDRNVVEKHSGSESDTSSTKPHGRWFRRGRQDVKNRTSSDSGSEQLSCQSKQWEPKRASSLDSVTLPDSQMAKVVLVTEQVSPKRSSSQINLQVPEATPRRQSSPALEHCVITASLKIPVPLNLEVNEIPFIEEDHIDGRLILTQHDDSLSSVSFRAGTGSCGDSLHADTASETPSSHATSTASSPGRLSSASVTWSAPMSPEEPYTLEPMTARFLISHNPVFSSTPTQSASTVATSQSKPEESGIRELSKLPVEEFESLTISSSDTLAAAPPDPQSVDQYSSQMSVDGAPLQEPKSVGKETKAANIAGLIKSKTASFEKLAKQSQVSSHPSSTLAEKLRLRQGNVFLKQEYLLKQGGMAVRGGATNQTKTGVDARLATPCSSRETEKKTTDNVKTSGSRLKRSEIIASSQGPSPGNPLK